MSFVQTESLQVFKIKEFRLFILVRLFLTHCHPDAVQYHLPANLLRAYSKDELILGLIGLTEAIPFHHLHLFSVVIMWTSFQRKK